MQPGPIVDNCVGNVQLHFVRFILASYIICLTERPGYKRLFNAFKCPDDAT